MRKNPNYLAFVPKLFTCLFQEPYNWHMLRKDLLAGATVGVVALPLAMAFAIASGVPPEKGLYTAIIAGFLISLFGGSRVQIGGPTGAFVVIVYSIVQRQGYEGLLLATLLAGVILLIAGFARLGTLIKYIPYPLVTGFTSAIALIIFSSQVKDFFGLRLTEVPADFLSKWKAFFQAAGTGDLWTLGVSASTLALILFIRRFFPKIPWGIVSIGVITLLVALFHIPVETIQKRFGEIPHMLPTPGLIPHSVRNLEFGLRESSRDSTIGEGASIEEIQAPAPIVESRGFDAPKFQVSDRVGYTPFSWDFAKLQQLFPDAMTIALLAGIESLLSAVVADGMIGGAIDRTANSSLRDLLTSALVFLEASLPQGRSLGRLSTLSRAGELRLLGSCMRPRCF